MTNIKQLSAPKLEKVWIDETGGLRVDLSNDYHFRVQIQEPKTLDLLARAFDEMGHSIYVYARTHQNE